MTATLLAEHQTTRLFNVKGGAERLLHPDLLEPKPRLPLNTTEEPSADRC